MYIVMNTRTHNSASHCLNCLHIITHLILTMDFPGGSVGKESAWKSGDAGDVGSIPGWRRSLGGEHGNPLQYSCLENPVDNGAWRDTIHSVAKSRTRLRRLSTHTHACSPQYNPVKRKLRQTEGSTCLKPHSWWGRSLIPDQVVWPQGAWS